MQKFTIDEIRIYLLSQDSMGDILYNLSEANIIRANDAAKQDYVEDGDTDTGEEDY